MDKLRKKLFEIIFEADTFAGKAFDISLLLVILISTVIVILESVNSINQLLYNEFKIIEWTVTQDIFTEKAIRLHFQLFRDC